MDSRYLLMTLLMFFSFQIQLSFSGQVNSFESVPDLQQSMYTFVDGYPCVRLLNISGEIGCSNPGREKVVAPVVRFNNTMELYHSSTILVSLDEFQALFDRISSDSSFGKHIVGVLVESWDASQNKLNGFSPTSKFPEAEFAPYKSINYEWNPNGLGAIWKAYNFPVFLLSESSTVTLQEAVLKNVKRKRSYTADVAEFNMVMETTKSGTRDSQSCLKEETCIPLGGYSVWASLRPIIVSSAQQPKPIILAVATMDAASFFRDKSLGADSPVSGLIALLAAVDALTRLEDVENLNKQLVFAVFTGEAWGYLGSRRFLLELDLGSDPVSGLNSTLIETVMEIGSVGKGFNLENITFFAHTTGVSSATNQTLNALKQAQDSLKSEHILISSPSIANPGIPPSSLMAFVRESSQTSGVVLEDFDSSFANKFYHSHLDDFTNVNSSSIVAAASLVAHTLYILASNEKDISTSSLNSINVNTSLVEELMGCLLKCEPGMYCDLVKDYILPSNKCPSHYVGVIQGEPSSAISLAYADDNSRLIWNFLADKTSIQKENSSACSRDCSNKDEVCLRSEIKGKGVCVLSTTRYVPAYSTRLKYESGIWSVLPPNSSDPMGIVDPVWTESNWAAIVLRVYTVQDAGYDHLILLAGIVVLVGSYIAIEITKIRISKALKQD